MKHGTLKDNVWVKKEQEINRLRLGGGSWSINLDELPESAFVIKYETAVDTYRITRAQAFDHGFIRVLAGERKLVVPIKYWIKRSEFEHEPSSER